MALLKTTVQPDATEQVGAGTVIGAVSISAAWADASDATYGRIGGRIQNPADRVRVSFPTPTIPAGAKVTSVTIRDRVRGSNVYLVQDHYIGCRRDGDGDGDLNEWRQLYRDFHEVTDSTAWVDRASPIGTVENGPDQANWDAESLANLFYEVGRSDDNAEYLDIAGVWADIYYQRASTVTITAPTGTVSTTRPTIKWTFNSPDQQPQAKYRVAIYRDDQVAAGGFQPFLTQPIQASGADAVAVADRYWVSGAEGQWQLTSDLTDDTYYAYVQASALWTGAGDFVTDYDDTSWTRSAVSVTPPPNAILQSATYNYTHGWVDLTAVPSSGSPATDFLTYQVCRDGDNFFDIPSATRVPANGLTPVTAKDVIADFNVATKYRVISVLGNKAALLPSNELTVTPQDDRDWFINVDDPDSSTPVRIKADGKSGLETVFNNMDALYYLIGGEDEFTPPKKIRGAYYGEDHKLTLRFQIGSGSLDYLEPVRAMVKRSRTIRWKSPEGVGLWCVIGGGADGDKPKQRRDYVAGNRSALRWVDIDFTLTEMGTPSYY